MHSFLLVLALAAPISAVAATPTYSNPVSSLHQQKEQVVHLLFVNYTVHDRELQIGNQLYRIPIAGTLRVYAPVGSPVLVYSETSTKVNGQELMRVSAKDQDRSVLLR